MSESAKPEIQGATSDDSRELDALFEPRPVPDAGTAAAPTEHYRIAGDSEARAAQLEQELTRVKTELHDAEHELYAARHALQKRSPLGMAGVGGIASMIGSLIGVGLDVAYDNPDLIAVGSVVGFLFGLLAAMRWDPPNDKFPPGPPARLLR